MTMKLRGKWAQGIQPRHFAWVIKDRLAVCERPGGYGTNHRRVRRQEEIIWLREQGFGMVVSLIPSPHNLHNYDELGLAYRHHPFGVQDDARRLLTDLYPTLRGFLKDGTKVIVHADDVGDRVAGALGGYLRWTGMVPEPPKAVAVIETIVGRQLGPLGRSLVALATDIPQSPPPAPPAAPAAPDASASGDGSAAP
jgi:hypothetical protein